MDEKFMQRAIELAKKGWGYVTPNPLVGAVIAKGDRIIGEGYHAFFGGAHAEINAFKNATEDAAGATMYVTLEPCSHYGKTPPCVDSIIEKRVKRVVIGMKDSNPLVCGRGIEKLKENGIEVIVGVLEKEISRLNEAFIKHVTTGLPFCIMKTAMTLDGKIATATGDSKWISNEKSREYVHLLRHKAAAIMVGVDTVIKDDPTLTTRLKEVEGVDAVRIVVDTKGRTPLKSRVLNSESKAGTIIVTAEDVNSSILAAYKKAGAEVLIIPKYKGKINLKEMMKEIGKKGINSVLLEGGGTLNYSALEAGVVDKVISFIAPKIVGGKDAKTPVEGEGKNYISQAIKLFEPEIRVFNEDIMIEAYVRKEEE